MKGQFCLWSKESAFSRHIVASPCDLPSLRYNLLEITLSFQNAQSVPILVSKPLHKGFCQLWLDKEAQSD